jgi:hypothetical protein
VLVQYHPSPLRTPLLEALAEGLHGVAGPEVKGQDAHEVGQGNSGEVGLQERCSSVQES